MADFVNFTPEFLQTSQGIAELNRILNVLNVNIAGDAEGVRVFRGYGTPESTVTADVGSIYLRLDGSTDTTLYRKESGSGATGWVATKDVSLPLSLANGGTGQALVDPNADKILFWDDSEGKIDFLVPNTNLSITGTNLNVSAIPTPGFSLISTTTVSAANNTGDIAIEANKDYLVIVEIDASSGAPSIAMLISNQDGASDYKWVKTNITFATTPVETRTGDDAHSQIDISSSGYVRLNLFINTKSNGNMTATVHGRGFSTDGTLEIFGVLNDATAPTSFEFFGGDAGNKFNAVVKLYEAYE